MASLLVIMKTAKPKITQNRRPRFVKYSKAQIHSRVYNIPQLKFEDQRLTSFAGLVVVQSLFSRLNLKEKLKSCFKHMNVRPIFGHHIVMLLLIVHLMLGYRRLRDIDYYREDPMLLRLLGLKKLPDVSTVCRALRTVDKKSIEQIRKLCREMFLTRLKALGLARLSMDFDGSVFGTGKAAEGTAVGFNKKKKGQRSYYNLFCTIAQTGQVFDVLPRSGNVHDSNGAREFILQCIGEIRKVCPGIIIEVRMDSAFFNDEIVTELDKQGVEFTISVPLERFVQLKGMIEGRKRWRIFNEVWSYFETQWKPKKWDERYRFVFIRQKSKKQNKEPIQLDFFIPHKYGYDFKVIVTNKQTTAKKVLMFHNGRGSQENLIGEMKSQAQLDYIAVRRLNGNHMYMMSAIIAHNITRELQMMVKKKSRNTTEKRAPLWKFQDLNTIRQNILQRAGRITRPEGTLTLTMNGNAAVSQEIICYLEALQEVA